MNAAFRKADKVVKVKLLNQRVHPVSLEPRGIAASYDGGNDVLTIWLSTQDPHNLRDTLADLLRVHPSSVRVIAPDVGGGFGGKAAAYQEDVVVCFAARHFKRPIKWEESRREHMLTMTHGRGQNQWAEVAVRKDGKILGYRIRVISDGGAYSDGATTGLPELTAKMGTGVYDIPAYEADIYSVFTNKVPHGAYRGAGRPEAAYLLERTMNVLAAQLKLDPVKVRQDQLHQQGEVPVQDAGGLHLRHRRLRDEPDKGSPGLGLPEAATGAAGGQGGRPALRDWDRHLDRDLRLRPRDGPDRCRHGHQEGRNRA